MPSKTDTNVNGATTDATDEQKAEAKGILDYARMPFDELTADAIADVTKDKSSIRDFKRAGELYSVIESNGRDWLSHDTAARNATRKAAIAYVLLRREIVGPNGPMWAAQSDPDAWKIAYVARLAETFKDEDERQRVDQNIRKYVGDRGLLHAAMAWHAMESTNGLARELVTVNAETGDQKPLKAVLTDVLGPDTKTATQYDGIEWPQKLIDAVESLRQKQRKKDSNKFHRGMEYTFRQFGKQEKPEDSGDSDGKGTGNGKAGNVGHMKTQKSAKDVFVIWTEQDSFNPVAYAKFMWEMQSALSAKLSSPYKDRARAAEYIRAYAKEANALADFITKGNAKEPSKETLATFAIGEDLKQI